MRIETRDHGATLELLVYEGDDKDAALILAHVEPYQRTDDTKETAANRAAALEHLRTIYRGRFPETSAKPHRIELGL